MIKDKFKFEDYAQLGDLKRDYVIYEGAFYRLLSEIEKEVEKKIEHHHREWKEAHDLMTTQLNKTVNDSVQMETAIWHLMSVLYPKGEFHNYALSREDYDKYRILSKHKG